MIPTLEQFLTWDFPKNSYVKFAGFKELYVRSTDIVVIIDGVTYICTKVIQIGRIEAKRPGNGAFTNLVEHLVSLGYAIFVECVHNERFQDKLARMGFVQVNVGSGFHFLYNHQDHLRKYEVGKPRSELL